MRGLGRQRAEGKCNDESGEREGTTVRQMENEGEEVEGKQEERSEKQMIRKGRVRWGGVAKTDGSL